MTNTSDYLFGNSGGAFTADVIAYGNVYAEIHDETDQAAALTKNDFNSILGELDAYIGLGYNYDGPMDT